MKLTRQKRRTQEQPYTTGRFTNSLVDLFITAKLPFSLLELPEFTEMIHLLRPSAELPNRRGLKKRIYTDASQVPELIRASIPNDAKVSLALDVWSSPNHISFLGIAATWIEGWQI